MDYEKIQKLADRASKNPKYLSDLWEAVIPVARRVAGIIAFKYSSVDFDDMEQAILLKFPQLFNRYDPSRGTEFGKFIYFAFYSAARDELRRLDPLGVKYPQRKKYPPWKFLQDLAEDPYAIDVLVTCGMNRLDNGEFCSSEIEVEDNNA